MRSLDNEGAYPSVDIEIQKSVQIPLVILSFIF